MVSVSAGRITFNLNAPSLEGLIKRYGHRKVEKLLGSGAIGTINGPLKAHDSVDLFKAVNKEIRKRSVGEFGELVDCSLQSSNVKIIYHNTGLVEAHTSKYEFILGRFTDLKANPPLLHAMLFGVCEQISIDGLQKQGLYMEPEKPLQIHALKCDKPFTFRQPGGTKAITANVIAWREGIPTTIGYGMREEEATSDLRYRVAPDWNGDLDGAGKPNGCIVGGGMISREYATLHNQAKFANS